MLLQLTYTRGIFEIPEEVRVMQRILPKEAERTAAFMTINYLRPPHNLTKPTIE
jgi:hypothetical protein